MPFARKKSGEIVEVDEEQAAQLSAAGKPVYASMREANAPAPQVGAWQQMAPANSAQPSRGPSVMEVLFPSQQAAGRAGRGALAGNVETAKDLLTMPYRAAAGVGSYFGTLGSEAMDGGLASPQAFGQAKELARQQALRDMAAPGADIDYPAFARGFVAPAQDPVAAGLTMLPMGKLVGSLAGYLGGVASQGGRLATAAAMGAEALGSPVGQGLGIGATGAGLGLGLNALDRAVTPGQSALNVSPEEVRAAALQTALGGVSGGLMGEATRMASSGKSWLGGRVPEKLEKLSARMVRGAVKPNGLDAGAELESALVEDRLLPELVGNATFTPGQIAARFQAKSGPISERIGAALAEADKAGPVYSSAQALEAGRNALNDALRRKRIIITPRQSEAILRNMEESVQNQTPPSYGPWQAGRIPEAPLTASEAYATKKALQDWGHNRLDVDPLLPSRGRSEAAIGASRNFNEQLEQLAPEVKVLDRELAPYSRIRDIMETASGPRSNRLVVGPTFLLSAANISGARQAWNVAQRLRALNGAQSTLPATLGSYLTDALQTPLTSQPQQPARQDDRR